MKVRGRAGIVSLTVVVSTVAATAPLTAQALEETVDRFAMAWGAADTPTLQGLMAESVRLELDGQEYLGVPPRQVAASLQRYLSGFEASVPVVDRRGEAGADSGRGFAELRWSPSNPETGQVSSRAIFVGLRRLGEAWVVVEIRVLR